MAHLYTRTDGDELAVLPLGDEGLTLGSRHDGGEVALRRLRTSAAAGETWALLHGDAAGVWVNGLPVAPGMYLLADADEVRVAGAGAWIFSNEVLPHVERFPGSPHAVYCARCKQPLAEGVPAVLCPGCRAWYHQSDELPCWNYENAVTCALCPQPTDLEGGYQRVPEAW